MTPSQLLVFALLLGLLGCGSPAPSPRAAGTESVPDWADTHPLTGEGWWWYLGEVAAGIPARYTRVGYDVGPLLEVPPSAPILQIHPTPKPPAEWFAGACRDCCVEGGGLDPRGDAVLWFDDDDDPDLPRSYTPSELEASLRALFSPAEWQPPASLELHADAGGVWIVQTDEGQRRIRDFLRPVLCRHHGGQGR